MHSHGMFTLATACMNLEGGFGAGVTTPLTGSILTVALGKAMDELRIPALPVYGAMPMARVGALALPDTGAIAIGLVGNKIGFVTGAICIGLVVQVTVSLTGAICIGLVVQVTVSLTGAICIGRDGNHTP
jgi:hypothetical protein